MERSRKNPGPQCSPVAESIEFRFLLNSKDDTWHYLSVAKYFIMISTISYYRRIALGYAGLYNFGLPHYAPTFSAFSSFLFDSRAVTGLFDLIRFRRLSYSKST